MDPATMVQRNEDDGLLGSVDTDRSNRSMVDWIQLAVGRHEKTLIAYTGARQNATRQPVPEVLKRVWQNGLALCCQASSLT